MPPDDESLDKATFRRQLDMTLRQRDPEALRRFLLESGQWQEYSVPADVPAAMWMMILASQALGDLHGEAQTWLRSHGYTQEAELLAGRKKSSAASKLSGGGHPQKDKNHRNGKRT